MSELKSHHKAVLEPRQLSKQFADRLFQLEVIAGRNIWSAPVAVKSRNSHKPRATIEQWLPGLDLHVFNAAELVFPYDVEERALG